MKGLAILFSIITLVFVSPAFADCGSCGEKTNKSKEQAEECPHKKKWSDAEREKHADQMFEKADKDKDGKLDKEELRSIHKECSSSGCSHNKN